MCGARFADLVPGMVEYYFAAHSIAHMIDYTVWSHCCISGMLRIANMASIGQNSSGQSSTCSCESM